MTENLEFSLWVFLGWVGWIFGGRHGQQDNAADDEEVDSLIN